MCVCVYLCVLCVCVWCTRLCTESSPGFGEASVGLLRKYKVVISHSDYQKLPVFLDNTTRTMICKAGKFPSIESVDPLLLSP